MGQKILVDTNISIGYIGNSLDSRIMDNLDPIFNEEYHLSIINKMELLGYPDLNKDEELKFKLLIDNSILHQINDEVVDKTITIRKKFKIKLPDAIIAATCLVNGLSILTMNNKDFEVVTGLKVILPVAL